MPGNPDPGSPNTNKHANTRAYGDSHPSAHDNAYTHGGSAHDCPYCANVNGDAIPNSPATAEYRKRDGAG